MKRFWLMKSEPEVFGIEHLRKKRVATWDGVRNYTVRNYMRDEMRVGDRALFYHSSCTPAGVAGEMEIVKGAFPDPLQFDEKSEYYDLKSTREKPRWLAVKVRYIETFPHFVTLQELRNDPALVSMITLRQGNRLSITPVTKKEFEQVCALGRMGGTSKK